MQADSDFQSVFEALLAYSLNCQGEIGGSADCYYFFLTNHVHEIFLLVPPRWKEESQAVTRKFERTVNELRLILVGLCLKYPP